jgi:hypothetical protein
VSSEPDVGYVTDFRAEERKAAATREAARQAAYAEETRDAARRAAARRDAAEQATTDRRAVPDTPQSAFREYKDAQEFAKDRARWLVNGWRISSVSDAPQRSGIARFATLGLGALVLKPKSHVYVTYEK